MYVRRTERVEDEKKWRVSSRVTALVTARLRLVYSARAFPLWLPRTCWV